ncbi:hypothetical protein AB0F71_06510 [Kitasatospora sp. NPDC028055]|uniref:hypothetical protein n=1 Tax=Kitasatospora sp. NPDC028055 TaxID=3155653 RepID=UPI0033FCF99C
MSLVRRVIGAAAVALVAALGLLVLSQSASALTRAESCPRMVAEATLVEEAVVPECPPGLGWTRHRTVEVPRQQRELHPALAEEAADDDNPSPARTPAPPYGARRQPGAAVLQVFRC